MDPNTKFFPWFFKNHYVYLILFVWTLFSPTFLFVARNGFNEPEFLLGYVLGKFVMLMLLFLVIFSYKKYKMKRKNIMKGGMK